MTLSQIMCEHPFQLNDDRLEGDAIKDYAFNYRENGLYKICQYKVLFDKNMNAQQFYWYPHGCNSEHEFNLAADFLFDFDKDNLTAEGKQVVTELVDKLKSMSVKAAAVEGYTDRMGSEAYNLDLSQPVSIR
ncbi:outer membrane lipoprotein PlpD [[Pasteurella] mairii]|uniref:Outer membrane lipoprotein PlpD n=1 Tax=[Pasteurella] mairii TaxID=757 RepID=A0A379B673_9PAST|nr:outer membrane lipoprotein PlpD [[Pasteurella] mairii]